MIGVPPRSGQPVTVDTGTVSFTPTLAKQYGSPVPLVYGTWRVSGKTLWLGTTTAASDIQVRASNPDGWKAGPGKVAPALIGLCEGEISQVWRAWRGGDCVGPIRMLSRPIESGCAITRLYGDGTEGTWALKEALSTRDDVYVVDSEATSFTVPDAASVASNQGATWQIGGPGGWSALALVGGAPATGQYAYSAGTYTFPGGGSNIHPKQVTVRRDLTLLPGWIYPMTYANTAQIRFDALSVSEGSLPNDAYEVVGLLATIADPRGGAATAGYDAHPADVLLDLLTHTRRGLGWATSQVEVDDGPDGTTASGYRVWCTAMGFAVSRAITDRGATSQLVEELLAATHARCVWSEGKLKVIPLGEIAIGSYTPAAIVANIGEDDFIVSRGSDPVQVQRVLPSETFTACPVSFGDRNSNYDVVTVETILADPFVSATAAYTGYEQPASLRRAGARDMPWVSMPAHAGKLSWLLAMRSLYCRNTYRFTLGPRWARLEPGDLLALTDPVLGLNGERVRVTSIEERDSGELELYCEEAPFSNATIPTLSVQTNDGLTSTTSPPPGTVPGQLIDPGSLGDASGTRSNYDNLWPNPTSEVAPPLGADTTRPEWNGRFYATGIGSGAYAGDWVRQVADAGTIYVDVAAAPGESFYLEAQAIADAGGHAAYVRIDAIDKTGALILVGTAGTMTGTSWTKVSASLTAPANTVAVRLWLIAGNPATVWFDSIYARRMVGGDVQNFAKTFSASYVDNAGAKTVTIDTQPDTNYTAQVSLEITGSMHCGVQGVVKGLSSVTVYLVSLDGLASSGTGFINVTILRGT